MHSKLSLAALAAAFAPLAAAHYNFESLIVNGEGTEAYEYVRRTKNSNSPIEDVTVDHIICNNGGIDDDVMAETQTLTVQAGDEIGFAINDNMGHPGPLSAWLSKAPGAAQDYKGDGDWFKVYELSYTDIPGDNQIQWATFPNDQGVKNFTFTLPAELPDGEYLLRGEHVGLHSAGARGGAQFYIGCAQIKVEGGGNGTPENTVQFPGAYDGSEPGLLIDLYWPPPQSYVVAGPRPWPSGCTDHTINLWGQESDGDCSAATGRDPGQGEGGETPSEPGTPSQPAEPEAPSSTAPAVPTSSATTPTPTPAVPEQSETPSAPEEPETPSTPEGPDSCPLKRRSRRSVRRHNARRAHKARF